ncbi:MAG: YigZ family protein [Clostridia bacterium]|nr:YigZ family protein [Clostridia bacterium]
MMFYTIEKSVSAELIEKKSKFIADLFYIQNQEEAENKIKEIKKKYHDAKHHCFAYITFDEEKKKIERCSDDGEPSGTAGAPMLELLRGKQLCNVLIVVTRYFGGILLGTGGLVRAYAGATKLALEEANFVQKQDGKELEIVLEYSEIENFKYYCRKNTINIVKEEYSDNVIFLVELTNEKFEKIKNEIESFNLKVIKIDKIKEKYI